MTSPSVTWPRRTRRLVLRPYRADADRLLQIRNQPDVWRWLLRTEVDPAAFTKAWADGVADPLDHSAVVELDGAVIGWCSIEVQDGMGQDEAGPSPRSEGLLGYIFDTAYAGHGYAKEAAASMVAAAFDELGLHRVTAGCFADNTPSWKIMESLGMRREQHGVEDSWHAELGWLDGYTYAILDREWAARAEPAPTAVAAVR
ncbi:GNAT family N-acetyltransferase [Luteipulveratus sp. YIM 133132]|uniref:GNAT family N-acetyltransferase n=1 Tax=Luteipulveratus flavus TaxID=3031728 RepID=UPI0023B054A6|nr:GNAT family N-acetyltransferase [Luteipulveratus sp. YIM 133132]MDE9367117.1 GNAT family N-acetyltransferase [Luteipulveratus sp. YIM 133132]